MIKPSRTFWLVVVLSLLWNGYGAFDYVMTQTRNPAMMAKYNAEQLAYYDALPVWMICAWAVGVWAAAAGAVLLALRRRWAFHAFVLSLIGLTFSLIYTYGLSDGARIMGQTAPIFSTVITVVGVFLAWYSSVMIKKGVLR